MRESRGGIGVRNPPPPLENHKALGFLAKLVRIPWKITKQPGQHLMVGHHRPASLNGVSLADWRWPAFSAIWILSYLKNQKHNNNKKKPQELDPLWQNFLDPRMCWSYGEIGIKSRIFNFHLEHKWFHCFRYWQTSLVSVFPDFSLLTDSCHQPIYPFFTGQAAATILQI